MMPGWMPSDGRRPSSLMAHCWTFTWMASRWAAASTCRRGGGTLDVDWEVASVTVPVSRVELVVNGEVREGAAVPPGGGSGSWSVKVAEERLAGLAGARPLPRQAGDDRRPFLAGDGQRGGLAAARRRRRGHHPRADRRVALLTWTRSARAPTTWPTSACAWCSHRLTAVCTTACTNRDSHTGITLGTNMIEPANDPASPTALDSRVSTRRCRLYQYKFEKG